MLRQVLVHHHARQRVECCRAVIPLNALADGQKLRRGAVALLLPVGKGAFVRSRGPDILP